MDGLFRMHEKCQKLIEHGCAYLLKIYLRRNDFTRIFFFFKIFHDSEQPNIVMVVLSY